MITVGGADRMASTFGGEKWVRAAFAHDNIGDQSSLWGWLLPDRGAAGEVVFAHNLAKSATLAITGIAPD